MGTPIKRSDIREGDLVRSEKGEYAQEWRVGKYWSTQPYAVDDTSYFLLDRPRKLIHAKGTTLYLKMDHHDAKKGDPVTVTEDCFEGERVLQAIQANGYKDGYPYEYWLTTEKPRVLKWAKGTTLYIKEGEAPFGGRDGDPVVLRVDYFEGDEVVDIEYGGSINGGGWYARRFTDEKPEPHPVGAIRWVTEDCKSRWGVPLPKGQRLVVERNHHDNTPAGDVLVTGGEERRIFVAAKFLSETLVEPEPTLVAVPLPAIEKLRDEHQRARSGSHPNALDRSVIRSNAIRDFLDTRAVKTALREDDEW